MVLEETRKQKELLCKMEREKSIEIENLQARWGRGGTGDPRARLGRGGQGTRRSGGGEGDGGPAGQVGDRADEKCSWALTTTAGHPRRAQYLGTNLILRTVEKPL